MRPPPRPHGLRGFVFGICLLLIRGVLLWIVLPLTTILWIVLWPLMRARSVRLGQLIGWADLNLVAAIEHTILRPLALEPYPWVPPRALHDVTHRVGITDPA